MYASLINVFIPGESRKFIVGDESDGEIQAQLDSLGILNRMKGVIYTFERDDHEITVTCERRH
jgi:hypothetical protein